MTGHEHGRWCLVGCDEGGSEPLPPADLSRFSAPVPMTAVDVDALDKLREAAKPGPWRVSANGEDVVSPTHGVVADAYATEDAAYLVAMHNALPDLLAEVRRGRALREAVEGLAADLQAWRDNAQRYQDRALARDEQDQANQSHARGLAYARAIDSLRAVLAAVDEP